MYSCVYDSGCVCCSGVDLYKSQLSETHEGGSSLSVLRTFRLLRILKLVRFLPNLRYAAAGSRAWH